MTDTKKHTTQTNQNKQTNLSTENATIQISPDQVTLSAFNVDASPEIRERPESLTPSPSAPKPQGFLRGLFDDLSIAQVIAGALAAATVFFLSSVIGVAGSLIGAAIGSVISAVSSQVYKKALSASADKLRDASSTTLLGSEHVKGGQSGEENTQETRSIASHEGTHTIPAVSDATREMNANDIRYASFHAQGEDPALKRAHERRGHKARVQRNVLVVSVVSSLIAIVICAAVITFATQGQGIGTKTDPILPSITAQEHATHSNEAQNTTSGQKEENNSSASSSGSLSSEGDSTQNSGNADNQNTTNNSGTSTGSGSGSTSGGSGNTDNSGSNSGSGSGSNTGQTNNDQTNSGSNTSDSGSSGSGSNSGSASGSNSNASNNS